MPGGFFADVHHVFALLNHTIKCRNGFLHNPLQPIELDSFVDLVFQDFIVVLIDVIDYHCPFYMEN